MTTQRDDLVAAAAVGLLQYRQIDPLLIFLLQRDVRTQREAMLANMRSARIRRTYTFLSYLAGVLAIISAGLFALLFTTQAVGALSMDTLVFFTVLYTLCAVGLSFWFKRRGFGIVIRALTAFVVALVPVAVFALQHVIS
ncbi:MAG: hypothetical protein V7642_1880 [Burkholderiales bacterium]|jgi:hypothetical protein